MSVTVQEVVKSRRDQFVSACPATECWHWQGAVSSEGYGYVHASKETHLAHRLFYEELVGPIPEGRQIDHLCRCRRCVNPAHLEAVTMAENILRGYSPPAINARKTHCVHGHPFAGRNLVIDSRGRRACRECKRLYNRRIRRAVREGKSDCAWVKRELARGGDAK